MTTGQFLPTNDGGSWWFDSGALSLDFAHTGSLRGEHGELLNNPADLSAWLLARYERVDADASDGELADAILLRDAIARLARAATGGSEVKAEDIDTVNLFAATPDIPPSLDGGRRQAGRARIRTGQALATVARDAVVLLGSREAERIRECSADDCHLVFYDESRTNNRRWCSMQRCGNRAKVKAYRARAS
jgi:predicted RNA-binding Zn ribbon-like protein